LAVIESFIFQDPWDTKSQSFDLAAFRDLLLLHAVAQSLVALYPEISDRSDLTLEKSPPPPVLDLDLSDLAMGGPTLNVASATDPDAHLPGNTGDLLKFDLPVVSTTS
jgi:hypothetical protein